MPVYSDSTTATTRRAAWKKPERPATEIAEAACPPAYKCAKFKAASSARTRCEGVEHATSTSVIREQTVTKLEKEKIQMVGSATNNRSQGV